MRASVLLVLASTPYASTGWREIWNLRGQRRSSQTLSAIDGWPGTLQDYKRIAAFHVALSGGIRAGHAVLDVGCGSGAFLEQIHATVPGVAITGIDFAPALVTIARERLPFGAFSVGDMTKLLPSADGSFDRVFAMGSLFYLPSAAGAANAVREMLRVAKPAATVVIGMLPHPELRARREASRKQISYDKASNLTTPSHLFILPSELVRFAKKAGACIASSREVPLWETELPQYIPESNYSYSLVLRKCGNRQRWAKRRRIARARAAASDAPASRRL